uniref:ANK_REP_REGION domain-containing protein n=1 Tax=Heterorhabditis bacteriophora TaxID=37862 RepID=A0A1I7XDJ4_HETBA
MGWTPLMWAVYKCHPEVVDILLNYRAHVNLIDEEDGLTPLIVASGRGFTTIVEKLLEADAQVNACDKFGSTALIWASRKGHLPIVQLLLNAGAEVDAVGMGSSTALMLATKGNYLNVVDLLLTREPNVNVADQNGLSALGIAAREGYADICESLINSGAFVNQCDRLDIYILFALFYVIWHIYIYINFMQDGETPLLRAVKSRHVALCDLLVKAGAKISAADNGGDNLILLIPVYYIALTVLDKLPILSIRAILSPFYLLFLAQLMQNNKWILCWAMTFIVMFSLILVSEYSLRNGTLLVCEPSLSLPLTIGLYAKWGSGKSVLLAKLKDSMYSFSRSVYLLLLSGLLFFYMILFCLIFTMTVSTIASIVSSFAVLVVIWVIGLVLLILLISGYCFIYYGSEVRGWAAPVRISNSLARFISHVRLVWNVITLYAPMHSENDMASNPVSFLFADYHRLSSIGGEQALAKIVATMFEAAETHFGVLPVRLFCSLRVAYPGQHGSLRRHCGVPIVLIAGLIVVVLLASETFMILWLFSDRDADSRALLFVSVAFLLVFVMLLIYPLVLLIRFGYINVPRQRVNAAARSVHKLRFEGLMQKLQSEVDLLADMIRSLDAFTRSQTRLVVVVDGLDNCEQVNYLRSTSLRLVLFLKSYLLRLIEITSLIDKYQSTKFLYSRFLEQMFLVSRLIRQILGI